MNRTYAILAVVLLSLTACQTRHQSPAPNRPEPTAGIPVTDDQCYGIARLSVASARENPMHMAEMATQVLLGHPIHLLERSGSWFLAETPDGYQAWFEDGTFAHTTLVGLQNWTNSPLLIITALEDVVLEAPDRQAAPVSDVVLGDLLKPLGAQSGWLHVALPDGRSGWLADTSAQDYQAWRASRNPTPENLERTARRLMGRPYLWGGISPKGLDCSGFSQLVYRMNGIALKRNSGQQRNQGVEVPLDPALRNLRKGDLLFFGRKAANGQPEHITHVGIYLQDKLFIHSSELVQINSLDPASPIRDEYRIKTLLHARRIL